VKHETVGQTARYWVGQDKQEGYMWKRAGMRFSQIRGQGHVRRIREVLQEDSCLSMYRVYDNVTYAKKKRELKCHMLLALYLLTLDPNTHDCLLSAIILSLLVVYFSQVKNKP
jgi:hypothetical protein